MSPSASSRPRVVIVTLYYAPERNFITADVARALAQRYDVHVITAQPNFPAGKVFDGFVWHHWRTRLEDGVRVTRVPTFTYRGGRILGRAANYLSFAFFSTLALLFSGARPDLWLVYQTPFSSAWGPALGRWLRGGVVLHIVVDLWPESMLASGVLRDGILSRVVWNVRRWTNALADRLVVTTPGMRTLFESEGIPSDRMLDVPVWTEAQKGLVAPDPSRGEWPSPTPYLFYAGTVGPSQGLETLIEAMALLQQRGSKVRARIAGTGMALPELESAVSRLGLTNVDFLGVIPPVQVAAMVRQSVAQVVTLVADRRFEHTIPSKLFGAIGAGVPILAGLEGDAAALAERSGLAIRYRTTDANDLCRAVEQALALDPAERARMAETAWRLYSEMLAPEAGLTRVVALVESMLPPPGGSTP